MKNFWILAQADRQPSGIESAPVNQQQTTTGTVTDADKPPATQQRQAPGGLSPLILFGLMAVLMYLLLFRGPRKKQQQHKQMVQKLQKNDKVRTIGGILGTVVDIKGDEITLKIDEANNTKIKVLSSAIGKTLSEEKL